MATPTTAEAIRKTQTVIDLETFEDVTLVKVGTFTPAVDAKEALHRLGNDSARLLEMINDGMRADAQRNLGNTSDPWQVEDEEGNLVVFAGTPADPAKVNALRLVLAKTVFGYSKDLPLEARQAAKDKAMTMIKTTDAIKNGLKTSGK